LDGIGIYHEKYIKTLFVWGIHEAHRENEMKEKDGKELKWKRIINEKGD
jgi:hypothetical protein